MADTSSASASWRFDALTRDQLTAYAPDCTVVVPLGSTEQHGHHLPVRMDTAAVTAIAEGAVERAAAEERILLAPTLPFGFAHHHLQYGGTISISSMTYVSLLSDIASSLARDGVRRLVFLNGHGGNIAAMNLVIDRLGYDLGIDIHVAAGSYWTIAEDALIAAGLHGPLVPGHAGHFETSLMLALHPELVQLDQRPDDGGTPLPVALPDLTAAAIRRPNMWETSDGRSDDASEASAETGAAALEVITNATADFLLAFHRSV